MFDRFQGAMKLRDAAALLGLSLVWGSSYLLMHAAGEFGAVPLAGLRASLAAALLLALLARSGQLPLLRRHWRALAVVGLTNSALPFVCFAYASTHIATGLSSVFGAAAPLFGAAIAAGWWGERLPALRWAGLALGLLGVFGLAWTRSQGALLMDDPAQALAIAACLAATLGYGFSVPYTRRRLAGVPPLAVAAGSQLAAGLALAVPAVVWWPSALPSAQAWGSALLLALVGTAAAYIVFFRLIARVGSTRALTVTFLIPVSALALGALVLDERPDRALLIGCGVILLGTALANGLLARARPASATLAVCGRPDSAPAR